MRLVVASLVLVCVAGCSSGTSSQSSPSPIAQTLSAAAVAADDPCALLTAQEINDVLKTSFETGEKKVDDVRQIVTCTYTVTDDSAGVGLPVSIVDVGVSQLDGKESFTTNRDLAPGYFGGQAEDIQVDGADKAYVVINESTDSPVVGMLVGDRFALIQIGVEGATADQAQQLAATAASRMG